MKLLMLLLLLLPSAGGSVKANLLAQAEQQAQKEHKLILLNFSGSDWCGPCIRMHREILDSDTLLNYARAHLVLINADFPRMKKHQLSVEQQKENNALAEKYDAQGIFPYTLLLNSSGEVLHAWSGFYDKGAGSFTREIKKLNEPN